jgi:hypothetical protein
LFDAIGKRVDGLEMVLAHLAEVVKTQERAKYVKWAFAAYVDHLDWEARESIVISYLKQNNTILPDDLLNREPARLTKHVKELIYSHISDESLFVQMVTPIGKNADKSETGPIFHPHTKENTLNLHETEVQGWFPAD